ncbi:MAG: 3-hydroxybutyryl-CoA dehydrogenase [Solirubrobacteraceae bacterium]|jgi:3-hydroxybutyryl-CoA dehydrogenase|nr:3-hydroxyacyl-CoA dehydrogenase family protein [Solirubrobacterales bacterium]MEA2215152.1 3-hydroxybutyryl-CoA dehydrogenase [Solirubrobacteraceae bacterium]
MRATGWTVGRLRSGYVLRRGQVLAEADERRRRREQGAGVTRVAVLGDGPRAAQLGGEFALGGCTVVWLSAEREGSQQLIEEALRLAAGYGLAGPADLERARALVSHADAGAGVEGRLTLILETLPERLEAKAEAIAPLAAAHPEALVASTSESVSVTAIGEEADVGERMIATRYGDPPMLSPLVELLAARDTPPRLLDRVSQLLRAIGKRPVLLRREVPGMLAGRLEVAVLRECLWLLESGVADAEEIDAVVRDGLARGWAVAGPLRSAGLRGGAPALTAAAIGEDPAAGIDLERLAAGGAGGEELAALRERRDEALAGALRAERARAEQQAD